MSFFITEEQQNAIDEWLDEQNKEIIDRFINDPHYDERVKEELIKNREMGLEVPPHNPDFGYYTISFTPTPFGNRIYAHHHVSNVSTKIFDMDDVKPEDDANLTLVDPRTDEIIGEYEVSSLDELNVGI